MKFLTDDEASHWWNGAYKFTGVPHDSEQWPKDQTSRIVLYLDLLPAASVRPLSTQCLAWLFEDEPDQVLLWVTEYAIWDSEDWNLYYRFRQSFGSVGHLKGASGHLLLRHERESIGTLISRSILFGWDVTIGTRIGRRAVKFDHDGHVALWCEHDVSRTALAANIVEFDTPDKSQG